MKDIIDIHVHFGGPRNPYNDCYWSDAFRKQPAYWLLKLTTYSLFKEPTFSEVERKILSVINRSTRVDKVVLLAMEKVYRPDGTPVDSETHLYVPDDYIIKLAKNNPRILLGSSVHPYRNDWKEELDKCIRNGAVLCKWIPSSQQIDVTDEKCFPMYDYLAEHNLPLLIHSGPEYSIPTSNNRFIEFNNPKYLRIPLDRGVTVIIAHCASPTSERSIQNTRLIWMNSISSLKKAKPNHGNSTLIFPPFPNHYVTLTSRISLPAFLRTVSSSAAIILSRHPSSATRKAGA